MKAAVLHGKEDLRIENVPERPLGPGEVRIRIEAALTCGTDLKVFKRGYHARMLVPPTVFGHELAGVIVEVSALRKSAPSDWQVGERVVAANSAPCGTCLYCQSGQPNLCDDLLFLNGAYAESIIVPARVAQKNMLRLKPATAFHDAALVEPLACVVQGLAETGLRAGQRVLVLGAGPIGLMFVALARHLGCAVVAAGRGETRLATARRLGAEAAVEVPAGEPLEAIIPEAPYDVVIEAVGKPETWEAAVRLARKGGKVNFFGGCPSGTSVRFDTTLLHYSNLTLLASFHHSPHAIRSALEFIEAGVVRAADFVDGQCALSELPALFKKMAAGNHAVKTAVRVSE
ncbi:MAG TPA: zinc-binding dehydrogenase [Verrucomicrobiae bacterium]|nr:zinc-binding dehydrogenase [Verrucomicrobiae bacterium]